MDRAKKALKDDAEILANGILELVRGDSGEGSIEAEVAAWVIADTIRMWRTTVTKK